MYQEACKEWRQKADQDKTWKIFSAILPLSITIYGNNSAYWEIRLQNYKSCRRPFTPSTPPACIKTIARNGAKNPTPEKPWTNFKYHFADEYHKIWEQQRVSGKAGFNSANLAHKTTDMATALDNLALAETADRNIVMDLIATNALLAATQGTASTTKPHNATIKCEHVPLDPSGYCWSHGYISRINGI